MNPWLQIWVRPKKTMRFIIETNPKRIILWLAMLSGALSVLAWLIYQWVSQPQREVYQNPFFVIGMLVIGALFGSIHLYLFGWLLRLTGGWIGGQGNFIEVKSAVGWSNYPLIIANCFNIISVLVVPNPWFQGLFALLNVTALVWGIVIFLNVVGEAHRFSAWKTLLAVIITLVLIFVVIMIVSLLVPLLAPLFN